ncbi:MAG: N-acetylmuramoyl-L-alanine amidase [Myxococcales bacterium]|nr:N-acetylmuramoyl-L-alanine amidase [Myxococcales bacterium]
MQHRGAVIIDPGHVGKQRYGGSSPLGVEPVEKQVNLDLARRVAARLGDVAQLTRSSDINVPLRERAQLAGRAGAKVLVSIHANSGEPGARGSEVWVHDAQEPRSVELAQAIHGQLERVGPTRGIYRGPIGVLDPRDTGGVAACLVEADYLSDPQGRERLTSARGLDQLADAIASGVRGYLDTGLDAGPYGAPWAVAQGIIEPEIDYASTSLAESNRLWTEWLARYGRWYKGVPDGALRSFPHAAICQLRMTMSGSNGNSNSFWGTGFYIGNDKLLTVGHNLRERDHGVTWTATEIIVEPGYSPRVSTLPTRSFKINDVYRHVHPRWSSASGSGYEPGYDLAVLRVAGLGATAGTFSLANRSLGGDEGIVVAGYGKNREQPFEEQPQRMDGAALSRADHLTMDYPIQTLGGHSGSPVFHDGMVVGVHRSTGGSTRNTAVTLTPEKIDWINGNSGNP